MKTAIFVTVILGVLVFCAIAAYRGAMGQYHTMMITNCTRDIVYEARVYAQDHEQVFPAKSADGVPFTTSTEAFNALLEGHSGEGFRALFFFIPGAHPAKRSSSLDPVRLTAATNSYSYVTGQTLTAPVGTPLVTPELDATGTARRNFTVVGFVSGEARALRVTRQGAGATVMGPRGSGVTDVLGSYAKAGLLLDP